MWCLTGFTNSINVTNLIKLEAEKVSFQVTKDVFYFLFLVLFSETRITREHDTAMNKLFDWQARFEVQLNETLQSVKEFYTKDRMSEAKTYLAQLEELKEKVQVFLEEVH